MALAFNGRGLDPERFELRRRVEPARMEPRVLDVLPYLASHRNRVGSKDELLADVWRMKFVSDSALARCIHEARRAPDADAHGLKVIRTPRHHPPDPRQGRPPTLVRRPR